MSSHSWTVTSWVKIIYFTKAAGGYLIAPKAAFKNSAAPAGSRRQEHDLHISV